MEVLAMTFKKLVNEINNIKDSETQNVVWGYIDKSFEDGKITWNDHELLYQLASKVYGNNIYRK